MQRRTRALRYVTGAVRPEYADTATQDPAFSTEEDEMTQETFNAMMDAWLQKRGQLPPGDFSAQARKWAEESGIMQGNTDGTSSTRAGAHGADAGTSLSVYGDAQKVDKRKSATPPDCRLRALLYAQSFYWRPEVMDQFTHMRGLLIGQARRH